VLARRERDHPKRFAPTAFGSEKLAARLAHSQTTALETCEQLAFPPDPGAHPDSRPQRHHADRNVSAASCLRRLRCFPSQPDGPAPADCRRDLGCVLFNRGVDGSTAKESPLK